MNKYFQKFLSLNKKIYKEYGKSKKNLFLIDRGRYPHAFYLAITAVALNKKYKCNTIIFSEKKENHNIIDFYKSFGFRKFYFGIEIFFLITKFNIVIKTLLDSIKSIFIIKYFGFDKFINEFKIKGINIGDLIYDQSIRLEHRYLNPKVDIKFIQILLVTIFKMHDFLFLFEKYKPKIVLVSTSGKASNVGVATRVGVNKKIKVIELSNSNRMDSYYILHDYFRIQYGKNLMLQKKAKSKEFVDYTKKTNSRFLSKFFHDRSKASLSLNMTGPNDLKNDKSKIFINKEQLLKKINLNGNVKIKKIILVAPHAFSDSPHDNGLDMIFSDYYSHLKETLIFIDREANTENIVWLVKPHPSSVIYNEIGIVEELVKKIDNPKILMCPKKINSYNLSFICDNVITLRGTIGLEFPCQRKYSITAGIAPYSNLGLSFQPKNKKKYFDLIKNIIKLKKLTKKQSFKAKKILYYFETKKQHNRLKNSDIFQEFVSKVNISGDESKMFTKKLIQNYQRKISFDHDSYYKDVIKKFKI